jgi:hypothetical protein
MTRSAKITVALVALLAVLVGCSVGNPDASQISLQYGGGDWDNRAFVECEKTHDYSDPNDVHYYYPIGQRDYTFRSDPRDPNKPAEGADAPSFTSTSKDPDTGQLIQLRVSGTLKFTLDTSCEKWTDPATKKEWPGGLIQFFHETIAKDAAPTNNDESHDMKPGWRATLIQTVGAGTESAVDSKALAYSWTALYGDDGARQAWTADAFKLIKERTERLTGGAPVFIFNGLQLDQPDVPQNLLDGIAQKQAAQLKADAVKIDENAAGGFQGGIVGYRQDQLTQAQIDVQKALAAAINNGKITPTVIQGGNGVNMNLPAK